MADDQRESDPLPYLQVDRSVLPAAGQLASLLGVTRQHALGALIEFWGCARGLETSRKSSKTPEENAQRWLITPRRWSCASNWRAVQTFSTDALVELQLVEPQADGYRVRGLSRYFEGDSGALDQPPKRQKGWFEVFNSAEGRWSSPHGRWSHRAVTERSPSARPSAHRVKGQRTEDRDQRTRSKEQIYY